MKSLRNTTGSAILVVDTGVSIAAGATYTIPPTEYGYWAASVNVNTYITSGALIVNDGLRDLSAALGQSCIDDTLAENVVYDNATSTFAPTTDQAGLDYIYNVYQTVSKAPTGFPNKFSDSVITWNNGTLTFSIAPLSGSYPVYIRGKLFTVSTTKSVTITDTEGLWYFYFDSSITLVASQTSWDLTAAIVPIASGYWDSTNNLFIRKNEERHGTVIDSDTHNLIHQCFGPQVGDFTNPIALTLTNYVVNGNGSSNSHAQYAVNDGLFFDEDLIANIKNSASPVNEFEQVLSPIAQLPVFYLSGNPGNWRKKTATVYPFYENGSNPAFYNLNTAGTWSLAACTNGYYFATWHVYSDDMSEPVAVILGQTQDSNLIQAINDNTLSSLALPKKLADEFYFYKKLIWQTSTTYTNTPKTRLVYVATSSETNPSNDRYSVIGSYNGNATSGKYLEWYPGQSSDTAPFPIPDDSYIRTVTLSASASSTGIVEFYTTTTASPPYSFTLAFSISLAAATYAKLNTSYLVAAGTKMAIKIQTGGGTISKPMITMFVQTSL